VQENAKAALPTPADLLRAIHADGNRKECAFVAWARDHDDEYLAPLREIIFGDSVSWMRAAELIQSLGIDRSHTTIGNHRRRKCKQCNEFFQLEAGT